MSFRFDLDNIDRRRLVPGLILIGIGLLGLLSTLGWFGGPRGSLERCCSAPSPTSPTSGARRTGSRPWRLAAYPLAGLAIAAHRSRFAGRLRLPRLDRARVRARLPREPEQWWAVIPPARSSPWPPPHSSMA
jgi:hypothetical protein